jgi:hypothetical protein
VTDAELERLAADFEALAMPSSAWTHAAHLAVGAWHVARFGVEEATARLRAGIRALNESHGNVNTDSDGYHETITVAYVRLIAEFLAACEPEAPLGERVQRLLAGPVSSKGILLRYWSRERLMSASARARWLEPDVAPLGLSPIAHH